MNRSLLAFERCPDVAEIVVVTSREKIPEVQSAAARLGLTKLEEAIEGGAERHLSVSAGIERIDAASQLVAVHDGARPLVTPEAISRCASVAEKTGAATLAHRVADTLKRGDENQLVAGSVSRENLWAMETPQIFSVDLLRRAYETILARGELVTDEVSAIEAIGEPVQLVENAEPNGKITVPADLVVAAAVIQSRTE